jgi:hypothetical protein
MQTQKLKKCEKNKIFFLFCKKLPPSGSCPTPTTHKRLHPLPYQPTAEYRQIYQQTRILLLRPFADRQTNRFLSSYLQHFVV